MLDILDVPGPLVAGMVLVDIIVDAVDGAALDWVVGAARGTERRVLVPASYRQCHRTCSEGEESRKGGVV